jgi:uncharacterized HAD superfamily protein
MEEKDLNNRIFLIDLDGTVCEDINNEDSHLYPYAKHYPDALNILNGWYEKGNIITFFTAREEKDRKATEEWLKEKGFKYHGLLMNKPRIKEGQIYHWIDNKPTKSTTFNGKWTELVRVNKEIDIFDD